MCPLLHNLSMVDNDDIVGIFDCRESMRYHYHRPTFEKTFKISCNGFFGSGVEGVGSLIKNYILWVPVNRTGYQYPLTLPYTQAIAAITKFRIEFMRQSIYKFSGAGNIGSLFESIKINVLITTSDVESYRFGKNLSFLHHYTAHFAPLHNISIGKILRTYSYPSFCGRIISQN